MTKKDIKNLPFEELHSNFLAIKNGLIESSLAEINSIAQSSYKRKILSYKANYCSEGSDEQEDDSLADFKPIVTLSIKDLDSIIKSATDQSVDEFVAKHDIFASWSWLGSQMLAHLASYKLPSSNNISPTDFLSMNLTNAREKGIYRLVAKVPRGRILKEHTKAEHLAFCALVPAYMAAQKQYNGIAFSNWSSEGLEHLVDADMYAAMTCQALPRDLSSDEILAIRNKGLQYKSRAKQTLGHIKQYSPATYHMLSNISDTPLGPLPRYAKVMLAQIWCAHPQNRTEFMVLNPFSWDDVPPPLISSEIFSSPKNPVHTDLGANRWDI